MIPKTIAIVVLYNLKLVDFQLYNDYFKNFYKVIIVNNSSQPIITYNSNNHFIFLNNFNNLFLAGAYNLALDLISKNYTDINYVVFFDEDSEFKKIPEIFKPDFYYLFNKYNNIACISPQYYDTNSLTYPNYLFLNKFYLKHLNSKENFLKVSFTINSFSVWSYKSILEIGYFDTKLMLDHIDSDYCLRAKDLGYSIYINRDYTFNHTIGKRIPYSFCFFKFNASNHNVNRRIYITKNTILILKKYFNKYPILFYLIISRLLYDILGILMVEKNKISKLKSMLTGIKKAF